MASPSGPTAPSVPPPQPAYRRRSLAGPVVLILLGILFLLGNLGYLAWGRLGYLFARYWPLLIILWGLIKLIEHYDAQRHGYRTRGFGFGGIFLLVFVIICGLAASSAYRYRGAISDEFQIDGSEFTFFGNPYTYNDELEQPFPANANLRVVSDRGEVKIVAWDENNVKVSIQKKVIADSQGQADKINSSTKPTINVSGDTVTVNANTSAASGNHRVDTNLEIFVPRKAAADIATGHGDVSVRDRQGEIRISTTHGDVEVTDIQGNVTINLRSGNIRAEKIHGDLSCNGRVSDTNVESVDGSARFTGDYFGTMHLSRITKAVRFQSSRTDMELAKLDGDLTMESGELKATSLEGPTRVVTKSKDIHLDNFSGSVHLEDNNADIELTPSKLPLGSIQISNRRGHVHLVLPANAAFQLDAHASRGDISSDFPQLKVDTMGHDARASGSVGSGGPQIQLSTERGDIEIRKG